MYNNHFKFIKSPFELTPNVEFTYQSEIHLEVFKTLEYGIKHHKGFMVLTGPIGAGKTTICRLLIDNFLR